MLTDKNEMYLTSYNVQCKNKVQFCLQTTVTKNKCIYQVFIKVITVEFEI